MISIGTSEYMADLRQYEPFEISAISGAAFAMRKEVFQRLGGFETSFFMYYEDTDLSLRIRRLGLSCFVLPVSVVFHAFKESFHPQKIYFLERNRYLSLFSLFSFYPLILMLPSLLVMETVTWGYCLMKGGTTLRAKYSSWIAVVKNSGWIRERKKANLVSPAMLPFVLKGFDEHLELRYVGSGLLPKIASLVAWLSAAPAMALVRRMPDEGEQCHNSSPAQKDE